jgi:hypothetical protein
VVGVRNAIRVRVLTSGLEIDVWVEEDGESGISVAQLLTLLQATTFVGELSKELQVRLIYANEYDEMCVDPS